ncbi:TIGR02677 family protein [Frankia sp. AiPs1]|uniref:TIGR02677 family protein n=1 Tax=Frankia sp. AiPa1 TaxID=573492 RepID=UPI00202AEEF0|nr:TIGR02677 family protein [Frankia sp. AiPa1]MCL9758610.1 TIGR02677 family protein [Frankia sp. AiPa1]
MAGGTASERDLRTATSRFGPFTHVTTEKAELYRAIMRTFVRAKQRFNVHLRPEDVVEMLAGTAVPGDPAAHGGLAGAEAQAGASGVAGTGGLAHAGGLPVRDVDAELRSLVGWGNLRGDPDTSRVTTVEDFNRPRFLYQLTPAGEAAEAALATFDEALGRRGELQAVALSDIHSQLLALLALLGEPELDAAKAHQLLRDLAGVFRGLADNAQAFMGSLQRTIDLHDADLDVFFAYKEQLVEYLQRFIQDLIVTSARIVEALHAIESHDMAVVLRAVAEREARDAAPASDATTEGGATAEGSATGAITTTDATTTDATPAGAAVTSDGAAQGGVGPVGERLALWTERWEGLRHWFVGDRLHPPQARLLRERARAAVPALLSVVRVLNERRSGRSDRSADFRALALWFAQAPSDDDAHRLWRACFGLAPARHLTVDAATLAARAENPVAPSTPWSEAPPVLVDIRLRKTGRYERRGAPNRIRDRSAERRLLAERLAAEEEIVRAARRRLATGVPVRLSEIAELDNPSFRLFLSLLGDALARSRPGEPTVETTNADGTLSIILTATADGALATIPTSAGRFTGPDHVLEIHDLLAETA